MKNSLLYAVFLFLFVFNLAGQTKGFVHNQASGTEKAVLDTNGDGYTSFSTAQIITDDQVETEIPYKSLVFLNVEPNSDLENTDDCSVIDFLDLGDQVAVQSDSDANGSEVFRVFMGDSDSSSSSYPISETVYTISGPPVISQQPEPSVICSGNGTSFTVSATESPTSYQWQISTNDGGTWMDVIFGGYILVKIQPHFLFQMEQDLMGIYIELLLQMDSVV